MVCLSTDKAAYPVNAMGTSKAMMEKVIVAKSRTTKKTKICCTRYGNVMCSRGSVIPLWIDQICNGNPITLTEPTMTRFIMSLEEAVDLGNFYRVPCDKCGLNYDKYFSEGNVERAKLSEFNSNNTELLTMEETKAKLAFLTYIQEELAKEKN